MIVAGLWRRLPIFVAPRLWAGGASPSTVLRASSRASTSLAPISKACSRKAWKAATEGDQLLHANLPGPASYLHAIALCQEGARRQGLPPMGARPRA